MDIDYNSIPNSILVPGSYTEVSNLLANTKTGTVPNKIIVFGQMLATGTALPNVPIRVLVQGSEVGLFGRGSMLAGMLGIHWKNNNFTETWVVPQQDNPAGTKAVQTITVTGPATQAGTQPLYVHGTLVQIGVDQDDSADTVAGNIEAAINDDPDLFGTATVAANVVTVTANHKGVDAGLLDLRTILNPGDADVPGLSFAFAVATAGAGNPSLTTSIANLGNVWFNHITQPYTDATNMAAIDAEVDRRWGPTVQLETHAYGALGGTLGALAAYGDNYNTMDQSMLGIQNSPSPMFLVAAALGAMESYYRNIDPIKPVRGITLVGIVAPALADRFIWEEQQQLLANGISCYDVDANGNVSVLRDISMYRTNVAGQPDDSYYDVGTILGLIYIRYTERAWVNQRFQNYKLANNNTMIPPGSSLVTPNTLMASVLNLAIQSWFGFVIGGNPQTLIATMVFQRNSQDPTRVDSIIGPQILAALYVFANQIQFTQ